MNRTAGNDDDVSDDLAIKVVTEISSVPEFGGPLRRLCGDLARRVRLLGPLFDELREHKDTRGVSGLVVALIAARDLLRSVNEGSKLYQALQLDRCISKFQEVNDQIEKALSEVPYDELNMSQEVQEMIELVHNQFRRAKGCISTPDPQLSVDLLLALDEKHSDPMVLYRLSGKLQLGTINDIKKESVALHEMVISSDGEPDDHLMEMSYLLKKLRETVLVDTPSSDTSEKQARSIRHRSPVIPDDFRCPLSLELMKDPVIVSTGQTYERSCIQKWLDAGHRTCPRTQQNLTNTALTPNFVLKSLITQWCEENGIEVPNKQGSYKEKKSSSDCDLASIHSLLVKLETTNQEEQRAAAGELRLLAKRNADNRICIAEAGAIPLLVKLLSSPDLRMQEHAVTALLNLSINENNKSKIVSAGAIPDIVEVLKNASMEARENAAATLFSLSVMENNKGTIGAAEAIPPLIDLLLQGTPRGKKDAATALFNLCIHPDNKVRAVKAGIVGHLVQFLLDLSAGLVDEALAILAVLASHRDGKIAIGQLEPISTLIEIARTGSSRNRENAASVLWALCTTDVEQLRTAKKLRAEEALQELAKVGSDRAKRKARSLLELMRRDAETQ